MPRAALAGTLLASGLACQACRQATSRAPRRRTFTQRRSRCCVSFKQPSQQRVQVAALAAAGRVRQDSSQAGQGGRQLAAAPQCLGLEVLPVDAGQQLLRRRQRIRMPPASDERLTVSTC